jgi:integral membrane protein
MSLFISHLPKLALFLAFSLMRNLAMGKYAKLFKYTAIVEGWSYLILLFIAVPLKRMFDMPMAVRIFGSIHGFLFVAFCLFLVLAWTDEKWSIKKVALAFLSSLIPFGTFWFDRKYLS